MNLLFDTNIILIIVRAADNSEITSFLNPKNSPLYISIVSEDEIKSLALQHNWGIVKLKRLNEFLEQVNIIDVNKLSVIFIQSLIHILNYKILSLNCIHLPHPETWVKMIFGLLHWLFF